MSTNKMKKLKKNLTPLHWRDWSCEFATTTLRIHKKQFVKPFEI